MESHQDLIVRESCDWEYFAGLANCDAAELSKAKPGSVLCVEVIQNHERAGGFFLIAKPAGPELHSKLDCHGQEALRAFKQLLVMVKERGFNRLTTYVEENNRPMQMAVAFSGFRRVCVHGGNVHYERFVHG